MLPLKNKIISAINKKEITKFAIVGIINTIIGLTIIYVLIYLRFNDYTANLFGYVIGIFFSYILNKFYVFNNLRNNINFKEIIIFIIIFIFSYLMNIVILNISLNYFTSYVAQFFAIFVYTIFNFILNKFITFKNK
ncbi:GtrA family protein [Campylobacter hyointestinalis subsp. hyointestinalis]|uniref:GtrA family protein n=1 Tax=Campylobacter hyointestinalis TaxID=198 RepID=UPI000729C242|nr:GtrA family protein [Campylobacter hyointestinalis subsp. hyointestinalis]CUU68061.1 GtrA family protein [Campylobacter hyointestinalis subsp. hyointestinalis]